MVKLLCGGSRSQKLDASQRQGSCLSLLITIVVPVFPTMHGLVCFQIIFTEWIIADFKDHLLLDYPEAFQMQIKGAPAMQNWNPWSVRICIPRRPIHGTSCLSTAEFNLSALSERQLRINTLLEVPWLRTEQQIELKLSGTESSLIFFL